MRCINSTASVTPFAAAVGRRGEHPIFIGPHRRSRCRPGRCRPTRSAARRSRSAALREGRQAAAVPPDPRRGLSARVRPTGPADTPAGGERMRSPHSAGVRQS
ncbi:hypothetical protein MILUP08_42992 [Micromonospora lupini str. Lupac 08]|uniref:Uncharacterized protein n=1 Tax=Micromonospora lupini str. Lupac 08 TaxID=1150864 RepID=I0L2L4_9ACTN|nr:hypothetical protein MILUP08_42992 [Micromonospora lupini str. Lupac 08]